MAAGSGEPATPLAGASTSTVGAPSPGGASARYARRASGVLAYTIGVILFGAVVRITGSGAGCGQHWPTCQGDVVHLPRSVETAIELTHRLTSGLSLLLVVGLAVAAFRVFPRGHATRRMALVAVGFMITESLVGAALVLLRLVGQNTSVARAVVMAIHLVNTSFLSAAVALTAWTAVRSAPSRWRPSSPVQWSLLGGLVATLVVSVTGAVTALGDTLYPVQTSHGVAERLAADQSATATFLERGRIVHPALAFAAALALLAVARRTARESDDPAVRAATRAVTALVFAQVGAGVLNVELSAPGWMQVVHLGVGTLLWLALVVTYASTLPSSRPA